jgi:hypothetical protein
MQDDSISSGDFSEARAPVDSRRGWRRFVPAILLALFSLVMIPPGVAYRNWVWEFTDPGRFRGDINRNFVFGARALDNGYLNLYEDDRRDQPDRAWRLDYTPLRLLTFEAWAAWNRAHGFPDARQWQEEPYAFTAPLMIYYSTLEWLAAVAAMLIVRHWLAECARADDPLGRGLSPWTGFVRAMLAFALLWFDPGMAIIAHGWPSPNMWVVPFYLWTVLFCLWDRWFIAGMVMGVGAMMQGQQMFVMTIFILWPLFSGRPARAMRWACGFVTAFVGLTSGWMLSVRPDLQQQVRHVNWPAVLWVMGSLSLLVLVCLRGRVPWRGSRAGSLAPVGVALVVINLPAWITRDPAKIGATLLLSSTAIATLWYFSWTTRRYLLPLFAAGLLLACIPLFGASTAWWDVGFRYGAERFTNVGGSLVNNLGSILHFSYGWDNISEVCFTLGPNSFLGWPGESTEITIRQVMVAIYACFFVLAAVAMARQWRRRQPNLLVAIVLPWVLFFTLLPQMSPRYALFAGAIGAICIGHGVGMSLLALYFSALTVEQTSFCMMMANYTRDEGNALFNRKMFELFKTTNSPGPAWATLFAAGVFLYVSLRVHPKETGIEPPRTPRAPGRDKGPSLK